VLYKLSKINYLFFFTIIAYLPFISIISWGDDYGGYILQSQNLFNLDNFVNKQTYLNSLTVNNKAALYTPFGFPILLYITSFLHNWNIYIIKFLTSMCILPVLWKLNKIFQNKSTKMLLPLILLNPNIYDGFKDIYTEIPAFLFFLFGLNSKKNLYLKAVLYFISFSIRPSFIIFIFVDIFYDLYKNKSFKLISFFSILFIFINSLFYFVSSYLLWGNYKEQASGFSPLNLSRNFELLVENLFIRVQFLISETGRLFLGFENSLNLFLGLCFFLLLVVKINKYAVMIVIFSFSHILLDTSYYVRYLIPILFIFLLWVDECNLINQLLNLNYFKIFVYLTFIFYLSVTGLKYSAIDNQRGPHEVESKEVVSYIKNNHPNSLIAFHSPRSFRLISGIDAYKFDENYVDGSILVCEKINKQCLELSRHSILFDNEKYTVRK